jgi:hypothetical protein
MPDVWTAADLTEAHKMLLHLIHLHSDPSAQTGGFGLGAVVPMVGEAAAGGGAQWVRETPLLVLIYEGIVAEVFDYDYAPASVKVGRRLVYMNITQEGRDDLDDLREAGMVSGVNTRRAWCLAVA